MHRTEFTSTIPLEVIIASGNKPVDLNNIFIGGSRSEQLVDDAELAGFPRNVCGWIKGIYSSVLETGIHEVIAVTEGDCSYTKALMELLSLHGISVIPFAYPSGRDRKTLQFEIEKLMDHFQVGWASVRAAKAELDRVRKKIREVDRLTWQDNLVTGEENHYFQVSASDMNGNVPVFEKQVDLFLQEVSHRSPYGNTIRLGYVGVPPIIGGLYPFLESLDARIVFNETQRQFAMPYLLDDMVEQYRAYTYPYDIFHRIADILMETEKRQLDGIIHYVQSFCFRQIEDMILRQKLPLPILTLEGDKPGEIDARSKIRLEGFVEMLRERR